MTDDFLSSPKQHELEDLVPNFAKCPCEATSKLLDQNDSVVSSASPLIENFTTTVATQVNLDAPAVKEETAVVQELAQSVLKLNGSVVSPDGHPVNRQGTKDKVTKEEATVEGHLMLVPRLSIVDGSTTNGALPLSESHIEDLVTTETSPLPQKPRELADLTVFDEPELLESPAQFTPKRRNLETSLPLPQFRFSIAAAIVFTVSILCFCVSYDGDFVYDDKRAILKNKDLLPDTPLSELFQNDFWGKKLTNETSHKSYRPLTILTFRLSYHFGGDYNPPWFHVPNIMLHGIVSVLLLRVFSILFGGYTADLDSEKVIFVAPKSALLCALLFSIHPVHTEAVSGIVGRADLLCASLFLISFLLYVKACAYDLNEDDDNFILYRPSSFSLWYMFGSMLMCVLSVLCKEQGITVIGICSVYDVILVCDVDPLKLFSLRKTEKSSKVKGQNKKIGETEDDRENETNDYDRNGEIKSKGQSDGTTIQNMASGSWVSSLIKRQIILFITGLVIIMFRWRIMGSTTPSFWKYDNPHSYQNGTFIKGLNYNYLYSLNAWLLVNPWWLCYDWSMGCIPIIKSFHDARILGGLAVWTIVGALLFSCLKAPVKREQRLLTMALVLIVVPFLPASNLFFRVGFVIAERNLYLPSVGFCMLVALGVRRIYAKFPHYAKTVHFALVGLFCLFMLRCVQRSLEWRSEKELLGSGEKVCPLNAKIQYGLAELGAKSGDTDYAIEKYRLVIKLHPTHFPALNNIGLKLLEKREFREAERFFNRAIQTKPATPIHGLNREPLDLITSTLNHSTSAQPPSPPSPPPPTWNDSAFTWMNFGVAKARLKKYREAEKCYFKSLEVQPGYAVCLNNLGNLYLDMQLFDKAVDCWTNATIIDPTLPSPWMNLALQLENKGRYAESLSVTKKALTHHPNTAELYFNIGNVFSIQEQWEDSEKNFLKAIQLKPTEAQFYGNLGSLYVRWMKYDMAEKYYRKALSINPNDPVVRENLASLLQYYRQ